MAAGTNDVRKRSSPSGLIQRITPHQSHQAPLPYKDGVYLFQFCSLSRVRHLSHHTAGDSSVRCDDSIYTSARDLPAHDRVRLNCKQSIRVPEMSTRLMTLIAYRLIARILYSPITTGSRAVWIPGSRLNRYSQNCRTHPKKKHLRQTPKGTMLHRCD